jgi:nucleoside-diphosphate-sugar epimerase
MKKGLIAITGAGGFLGRTLAEEMARVHPVRLGDIGKVPDCGEACIGDLGDPGYASKLVEGAEALVISHMLSRSPGAYDHPKAPLDVNATATAVLFDAAVKAGCRTVVLISSIAVVQGPYKRKEFLTQDLPYSPGDLYGLSKAMQEQIASYYHHTAGVRVAMLRPAYVTDEATMTDKYGRQKGTVNWQFIDRRDIASAALAAIALPDLGLESFYILGHADADQHADVAHARKRLGWQPKHTFSAFPLDP